MREYFTDKELACKCGCGQMFIIPEFRCKLNLARVMAGVPFVITSGCRCEKHNRDEGGISNSAHTKGLAVDISAPTSYHRFRIISGLLMAGFRRIGINEQRGFIHVDTDEDKPQETIFLYPR